MGFCRVAFFSRRLFFHDPLGAQRLPGLPGQIWGAPGIRYCFPYILAGDHQPAHGYGFPAGGGHPAAPFQLRGVFAYDHPHRHRTAYEYPHATASGKKALIVVWRAAF